LLVRFWIIRDRPPPAFVILRCALLRASKDRPRVPHRHPSRLAEGGSHLQRRAQLRSRGDDGFHALIRRAQPIANAGFGQDELRALRIAFDLLPELANIDPQILRVGQFIP
jgi:hypothetical protein